MAERGVGWTAITLLVSFMSGLARGPSWCLKGLLVVEGGELAEHVQAEGVLGGQEHLVVELDELFAPALMDRVDPHLNHRHGVSPEDRTQPSAWTVAARREAGNDSPMA
jgi:hypothetical protein